MPSGMGREAPRKYAESGNGVEFGYWDVIGLESAWTGLFPEMRVFLPNFVLP